MFFYPATIFQRFLCAVTRGLQIIFVFPLLAITATIPTEPYYFLCFIAAYACFFLSALWDWKQTEFHYYLQRNVDKWLQFRAFHNTHSTACVVVILWSAFGLTLHILTKGTL